MAIISVAATPATALASADDTVDTFACAQPWHDLIHRLYGFTITPLTTHDASGAVTGLLPVSILSSPLTGRRIVSLPFSDTCPLLASDDATAHALLDQAVDLARTHRARYLELRTGQHAVLAGRSDFVASDVYAQWRVALTPDTNALFAALRKPVQRQVRKARKLGVSVRFAKVREETLSYHRLHLMTRSKKHGMPAQSSRFFLDLWDTFAPEGGVQVLLAEYEGQPIGGMVLIASGAIVRYAYGASDERFLQLAPNNLLMWEAIAWAAEHGYRFFDMGRTARDNHGLMEFKRGWGASEEPLPYYYWPQVAGLASTSEQSWKYRALTSCWKRLPLGVSEALGGVLYKHLG